VSARKRNHGPLEIKVLGEWRTTRDGVDVLGRATNLKPILHALVLRRKCWRHELEEVLPEVFHEERKDRDQAVRNALFELRRKFDLKISETDPVVLEPRQPNANIDLWTFYAHADRGRYKEAHALVDGLEPCLLSERDTPEDDIWAPAFEHFHRVKDRVRRAVAPGAHTVSATRARLLERPLVPNVGPQTPIRELRDQIEPLTFAWRSEIPRTGAGGGPITEYICETLLASSAAPRQMIVAGAPGAGKALTAISTFLRLTDAMYSEREDYHDRPVVFADAKREGTQPAFASDPWFEQRVDEASVGGSGRPIVIMPHADAYLARPERSLLETLAARVFAEADVVLCCNELYYEKALRWTEYGSHVVRLQPWDEGVQAQFILALHDSPAILQAFVAWRDDDEARKVLCSVPLHVTYVLSLITGDADAANLITGDADPSERISKRSQLFEQVARMRIRVADQNEDEDALLDAVASVAHRFYKAGTPTDAPIKFTSDEVREHLRARDEPDIDGRYLLASRTLLAAPVDRSNQLGFEDGLWGWFFTAYHLARTVKNGRSPSVVLRAFSKFFSDNVMEPCEEILDEWLARWDERIIESLRTALDAPGSETLGHARRRIARGQIAYLLGALANPGLREQLALVLDPSLPTWEEDPLVRRGLAVGMASGGDSEFADQYAEALRQEREQRQSTEIAKTNIGFLLSFRGDQPFDPDYPAAIGSDPNPVRVVADIVASLHNMDHKSSWRIKLATLVDLANPEYIPAERFANAVLPFHEELVEIVARLDSRVHYGWPELDELHPILDRVLTVEGR
jgi:hypothetical protein